MSETAIIGRDKECALIRSTLKRTIAGQSEFLFLEGSLGVGKSTLLRYAQQQFAIYGNTFCANAQCLIAYDQQYRLQSWTDILRQLVVLAEDVQPEKQGFVKKMMQNKGTMLDVVAEIMGVIPGVDIVGAAIKVGLTLKNAGENQEAFEERFKRYGDSPVQFFTDLTLAFARKKPTLLVLDDLQWADPLSITVIHAILMQLLQLEESVPVALLGAYRSRDSVDQTPGLTALATLLNTVGKRYTNRERLQTMMVRPLSRKSSEALLALELNQAANLSADAVRWFVDKSAGNPFLVKKLVELLKQHGILSLREDRYEMADVLSVGSAGFTYQGKLLELARSGALDGPEQLFAEGLKRLDPEEIKVLKYASVQGVTFGSRLLSASLGVPEEDVLEQLARLCHQNDIQNLAETYLGGHVNQMFTFPSDTFYRAVKNQLLPYQERLLQAKLAESCARQFRELLAEVQAASAREAPGTFAADLTALRTQVGEVATQAVQYYERAGRIFPALAVYLDYAEDLVQKVNPVGVTDKEMIQHRGQFFAVCRTIDRLLDDTKKRTVLSMEIEQGLRLKARANLLKGKALAQVGDYGQALCCFTQAEEGVRWLGDERLHHHLRLARIHAWLLSGQYENARRDYASLLAWLDTAQAETDFPHLFDDALFVLNYDSDEVLEPLLQGVQEKRAASGDVVSLAKVMAQRVRGTLFAEASCTPLATTLSALLNPLPAYLNAQNREAVFKIFYDLYCDACGLPDRFPTMQWGSDDTYKTSAISLEILQEDIQRAEALVSTILGMPFTEACLLRLKLAHCQYLLHARNEVTNFLSDVEQLAQHNPELLDVAVLVQGLQAFLGVAGILSQEPIQALVRELSDERVAQALDATDRAAILLEALSSALFDDVETAGGYLRKLLDIVDSDLEASIDARLWFAFAYGPRVGGEKVDSPVLEHLREAEARLQRHREKLAPWTLCNDLNTLGGTWCQLGHYHEGLRALREAMHGYVERDDYEGCFTVYENARHYASAAAHLAEYQEIAILYQHLQEKLAAIATPQTSAGREGDIMLDKEYAAAVLNREAAERQNKREALDLYQQAAALYQQVPYGETSLDDVYESMANALQSLLETEEHLSDDECWALMQQRVECLEKARDLNQTLMDYSRVLDLERELRLAYADHANPEGWRASFFAAKALALETGNILELGELYTEVVPDYAGEGAEQAGEDDSSAPAPLGAVGQVERENEEEEGFDESEYGLTAEELAAFYREALAFFQSKGIHASLNFSQFVAA